MTFDRMSRGKVACGTSPPHPTERNTERNIDRERERERERDLERESVKNTETGRDRAKE